MFLSLVILWQPARVLTYVICLCDIFTLMSGKPFRVIFKTDFFAYFDGGF